MRNKSVIFPTHDTYVSFRILCILPGASGPRRPSGIDGQPVVKVQDHEAGQKDEGDPTKLRMGCYLCIETVQADEVHEWSISRHKLSQIQI